MLIPRISETPNTAPRRQRGSAVRVYKTPVKGLTFDLPVIGVSPDSTTVRTENAWLKFMHDDLMKHEYVQHPAALHFRFTMTRRKAKKRGIVSLAVNCKGST